MLAVCVAFSSGALNLMAAPLLNFNVSCDKKRFDVDRTASVSTKFSKEEWGYGVTIENKSFKNLDALEVQYRQYKLDDKLKGDVKLKPISGSTTIASLRNGEKFKFDTTPVVVEKQELKAGWYYTDGSKSKVKDALRGLWLRILKDGQVVFEYQNPPGLQSKASWD